MASYHQSHHRERRGGGGGGGSGNRHHNNQHHHHQQHHRHQQNNTSSDGSILSTSSSTGNMKHSSLSESSEQNDTVCVVCFKPILFYAIGECDHLCCFECSTRIRVLCRQNDCPICRRDLAKVIFSKTLAPYKELDVKNRSGLYDKKYRICFTDPDVQQAFFELLDNKCPRCDKKNIPKFDILREHVRKFHELFYCDICTEHLKIFSSERRCYSRQDLAIHRRIGDPDNVGHRGHPLCEYCDKRFLDKDELFRHLRKEHFFCHFCDADGTNYFYGDYESLRDHFRQEHYLCEEGDCEQEQFTVVFRSEIDLRAHRASAHGKSMNKLANKQTRTLELEFSYAPRNRDGGGPGTGQSGSGPGGGGRNHHRGGNDRGGGGGGNGGGGGGGNRGGYDAERDFDAFLGDAMPMQHPPKRIDASSEQDFPSLGGTGGNPVFRPNNVSIRQRVFGAAGLARTKENFPALGSEGGDGPGSASINEGFSSKITASSLLKPSQPMTSSSGGGGGGGRSQGGQASKPSTSMMIHVSNRPPSAATSSGAKKSNVAADFPALPGTSSKSGNKNKDLYADMEVSSNGMVNLNAISAKHRAMVDDYVSVSSMVQKVATVAPPKETRKVAQNVLPSVDSVKAFPTLGDSGGGVGGGGGGSKPAKSAQWVVANKVNSSSFSGSGGASANVSSKKKPTPAPNLKEESTFVNLNALTGKKSAGGEGSGSGSGSTGKEKGANDKKNNNDQTQIKQQGKGKEKNKTNKENESSSMGDNFPALGSQRISDFALANLGGGGGPKRGPPGFENVSVNNSSSGSNNNNSSSSSNNGGSNGVRKVPAPPPGFSNVTLNSVARNTNSLTFTSSSGESYNILPGTHSFVAPSNASKRNQNLVTHFQRALKNPEALSEFRTISQMFRDGMYNPGPYYEHCKAALGERFADIFPELVALLPNITKQQELYLVYCQEAKNRPKSAGFGQKGGGKSSIPQLEVCQVCKQVLVRDDLTEHFQSHYMENNFPKLGANGKPLEDGKVSSAAWRK
ncbi:E3 ubiquitin-protein ligase ZNF598 isoform X2 [Ochlerotatus camptorhynchus]|uniref:E3 ubiquitin-protein ligase ZNF598 isoform X2 n=1 Tax=Ochlerotatus camptorhynchus TaxID=644619 RepID=UPI0031CF4BCA